MQAPSKIMRKPKLDDNSAKLSHFYLSVQKYVHSSNPFKGKKKRSNENSRLRVETDDALHSFHAAM